MSCGATKHSQCCGQNDVTAQFRFFCGPQSTLGVSLAAEELAMRDALFSHMDPPLEKIYKYLKTVGTVCESAVESRDFWSLVQCSLSF